jgi:hypothetical protein
MPNTRIIYNNAVDRGDLAASTTAGALAVTRLATRKKSEAWRSTGTSATLYLTLAAAELLGAVVLPYCNLTSAATMRVKVGATKAVVDSAGPYLYDSGTIAALAAAPEAPLGWGAPVQGVNSFAFGGASCARHWFTAKVSGAVVRIDLTDTGNPAGYVEASRLVVGDYWELNVNPDTGLALSVEDSHQQYRNSANDLMTELGTTYRTLGLKLSDMPAADRAKLWSVLCSNGRAVPLFVSVFPGAADGPLESTYQLLCQLSSSSQVSATAFTRYGASLDLVET